MTPRPAPTATTSRHKRPLSAIFLGPSAQLPPELPEPPGTASSPGSSGLPSPPASNSTGSGPGSNGGDLSNESIRVPASLMKNGNGGSGGGVRSRSASRSRSRSPSDDDDCGDDEDHTARLSGGPGPSTRSNVDTNGSALERVKSLTQRNRLVLNKLASLSSGSRLASPSPSTGTRSHHSPAPSATNSVSSSIRRKRSESISRTSGSETERENANDSEGLSETPTDTTGTHFRSASLAEPRASGSSQSKQDLPDRPTRGRSVELAEETRRYSISRPQSRAEDIEAAALAAVAKSRGETPVETRRRQPLPREFLGNESLGQPPQTPRRERTVSGTYSTQESPSSSRATLHDSPMSPRTRLQRYSTIREITRRNQTRWLSQDLSPLKNGSDGDSPTKRGDIGDSPRRNFVGESLRAAGLVKLREESDDVFGGAETSRRLRISSEVGARPSAVTAAARLEGTSRPGTRFSERPVASDPELRTPANAHYALAQRNVQTARTERPSTSLERYRDEPHTAPPAMRSYKMPPEVDSRDRQAGGVGGAVDRSVSQLRHYAISTAAANERSGSSMGARRTPASPLNLASAAAGDGTPEHTRLMLESLGMFESQLSRLPSLGSTTTVTIPELFRSAQNIVHGADALSNMLRRGTAHALEEQIDAELGEDGRAIDLVSLWRDVGAEYRESVRVSDELVRTMTSFLLGVGKVLREATSAMSGSDPQHNRTMSTDGSPRRRFNLHSNGHTPDTMPGSAGGDGSRSSLDGKSSRWLLSSGETGTTGRTATSFTSLHSANSTSSFRRLADAGQGEAASITESEVTSRKLARMSSLLSNSTATGGKRVESPQESKANISIDEGGTVDSPSAAAAARREEREKGSIVRRSNTVAAAPPATSTLPSESLVSRRSSDRASTASISRRAKTSLVGGHARTATSIFHLSSGSTEPTIAVNTTQASPERPRQVSSSATTASRTFGRTGGGAAVVGLQQSIERDGSVRKRTVSINSVVEALSEATAGREREREREQARKGEDVERGEERRRARASLDSATTGSTAVTRDRENGGGNGGTAGTFSARTARDRKGTGTVTSLFSRS